MGVPQRRPFPNGLFERHYQCLGTEGPFRFKKGREDRNLWVLDPSWLYVAVTPRNRGVPLLQGDP